MPTSLAESLAFLHTQTGFALYGMAAFLAGAASAWIVIHWRVEPLIRFALWMLEQVGKLVGKHPSMARLFLVIFLFNSVAMFAYMCSGVWVFLPAAIGFLTGMNLAIIFVEGRPAWFEEEEEDSGLNLSVSEADGLAEMAEPPPVKLLPLLCGLLVIVLELPAFWFSMGMGISLGHFVREHYTAAQILLFQFRDPSLWPALAERCAAYWRVIAPVLAVSALAEAYAVAESARMTRRPPGKF